MLKEELLTVSFTTFPTSCGIYKKWALAGVENKVEVCNRVLEPGVYQGRTRHLNSGGLGGAVLLPN